MPATELQAGDDVAVILLDPNKGQNITVAGRVMLSLADSLKHTGLTDKLFVEVFEKHHGRLLSQSLAFNNGLHPDLIGKRFVFIRSKWVSFVSRPGSNIRAGVSCGSSHQGLFLSGAKRYTNAPRDPNTAFEWL